MRRFAKSVTGETWFAGSNPVLSVSLKTLADRRGFFVALSRQVSVLAIAGNSHFNSSKASKLSNLVRAFLCAGSDC
jgi:hypothetical protein